MINQSHINKLNQLNSQSEKNFFAIEDMDWSQDINHSIDWVPEEMNYISYLPSYKNLDKKYRLRYNHLYALSICEQFVWLEKNLLAGILTDGMSTHNLPKELAEGMNHFYTEEEKHGEMFWRTLEKAEPNWYQGDRTFKIFKTNKIQDCFFSMITKYNTVFLVWIWLALFFEERTLDFSKKYQKSYQSDKSKLDFNFWQVHYYHLKDEIRHCQMDEIFLAQYYDSAPSWKRFLCGKMFHKLIAAYLAPHRNAKRMLNILQEEFPELKDSQVIDRLIQELPLLKLDKKFQEIVFGKKAIGGTLKLLAKYEEFNPIWKLFLNEKKEDFLV